MVVKKKRNRPSIKPELSKSTFTTERKEANFFINGRKQIIVNQKKVEVFKLLQTCPFDPFDFKASTEPIDKYYFDTATAQFYLDFFYHCLKFIEGNRFAGNPFKLESWQACVIANMYGWKRKSGTKRDPKNDFRRFVEIFIYVPRKNGKTPLAAGIAIIALTVEGEASGQVYSAAASKEQASLIYNHASSMIQAEPELANRCKIYRSHKSIEFPATNSVYKALSADADTKHGTNISCAIIDEVHAHPKPDLIEVLTSGTASRDQPQIVYTTTADYQRKSICNDKYEYACKVRDGITFDAGFFPVIYEAQESDDWTDKRIWNKCNPNLGVSVRREYLERECKMAQTDLLKQNTFKRLHLNIRTSASEIWFDMNLWVQSCKREEDNELADPVQWRKHMLKEMEKRVCYLGMDLSTNLDITSLVLFFPEELLAIPFFFIPENNITEHHPHYLNYLNWKQRGFLETTKGNYISQDAIMRKLKQLRKVYNIKGAAVDKWNAAGVFERLEKIGIKAYDFIQGTKSYNDSCKTLEGIIKAGEFDHGMNPVLYWMVSNAAKTVDANGLIKPSKKDSTGKIDGLCALLMSMGLSLQEEHYRESYENQGFLIVDPYDEDEEYYD